LIYLRMHRPVTPGSPDQIWKNKSPRFARLGPRSSQCIGLVDHPSALNSGPLLNAAQC
jgi:hypothetical protein